MWISEDIDKIVSCIDNCLRKQGLNLNVHPANFDRCIEVREPELTLWIRLLPIENKYRVGISTVELRQDLQRRGIFTKLYKSLCSCDVVEKVCIESVCSQEMLNWCSKNKLSSDGYYNFY